MLYRYCKACVQTGRIEGLADKIDVLYAAGRLNDSEYEELIGMLAATVSE